MGEDEVLDRLKNVLVESHPDIAWAGIFSKYQAPVETKEAAIRAEMGLVEEERISRRRKRALTGGFHLLTHW